MAARRWVLGARRELGRFRRVPFPLIRVIGGYTGASFRGDLAAAFQSALMIYPRALCCAFVAGLPPSFGLVGAAVASIVGAFFAPSKFLVLLPTRISAILLLSLLLTRHADSNPAEVVSLLTLMVAILLVASAYLDLGRAARLIPRSVFVGYACGAGLLVLFSQLHYVLGFHIPPSDTIFETCDETCRRVAQVHIPSLAVGAGAAALWLFVAIRWPGSPATAIVLVAASIAGAAMQASGINVATIGAACAEAIRPHVPHVSLTQFSAVASSAVAIALLGIAESSFVARRIAAEAGERDNTNREMFRLGLANLAASCFMAMPSFASPYCSRVNFQGGVRTPLSCLFAGSLVAGGVVFFGGLLRWTPVPAVAAVAICLCVRLVKPSDIRIAACATPQDSIVFLTTFFAALTTPLDIALYFGIGASVLFGLRRLPEPRLTEYTIDRSGNLAPVGAEGTPAEPAVTLLHLEGELAFGAGDALFAQVSRLREEARIRVVILQLRAPRALDATSLIAIRELQDFLRRSGRHLIIAGASREIRGALRNSGLIEAIGARNVLVSGRGNPLLATREALTRAAEILEREPPPPAQTAPPDLDM